MSLGPQRLGSGNPSLPVEITSESYINGRSFRTLFDFSESTLPVVLKFVISKDIDLTLATQAIYEGSLSYKVYANGVEGGVFSEIPQYRENNKSNTPVVDSGMAIYTGGSLDVTGINPIDETYLKTSGISNQASTAGAGEASMRGFPATTAYVVIDELGTSNNEPKGIVKYEWSVCK